PPRGRTQGNASMKRWLTVLGLCCLVPAFGSAEDAPKAPPAPAAAKPDFAKDVQPLVAKYCLRCHSEPRPRGRFVLDKDKSDADVLKNRLAWEKVADNLRAGDMPPPGARKPTAAELEKINAWLDAVVLKADCSGQRDPGRVTLRRLNRAEYDNTIR